MEVVRKKSPRAPSINLEEAIERALSAYEKDRTHPAPTEVMAQHLGYKSANNGRALGAIASLRYFGLLDRPKDGMLAVSKAAESYKFTPDAAHRRELLINFLLAPPLFKELLEQYKSALPSDATIRYELINRGFLPGPAEACIAVLRKSVEFADYFRVPALAEQDNVEPPSASAEVDSVGVGFHVMVPKEDPPPSSVQRQLPVSPQPAVVSALFGAAAGEGDRIPIRLAGGRRAWLVVPEQLFEADKVRLKAQIDLLLTVEQERSLE